MCIQVLSEFPIIYITCTYMQMNIEYTIHAHIMRNIFVFLLYSYRSIAMWFQIFCITLFSLFFNSTRTTKILSIFCLNGDHYFISKKKDCAALFQCYKFLLNCTFNSVFCNNVMSVWNGWLQQGKNKSKFIGKYMCFLLYRHTCCYMLECISL